MVPSTLNRFVEGPTHPRGKDQPIPEGDPTIPEVGGQNELTWIFFSKTVFQFLQLEQPVAVTDSYFLRKFSTFYRLLFTLSDKKLPLQFIGFVLIDGISGCLWFPRTQLYFKDASCALQGCFWFAGLVPRLTAPRLAGKFSVSISADIFSYSVIFPYNRVAFMAAHVGNFSVTKNFVGKKWGNLVTKLIVYIGDLNRLRMLRCLVAVTLIQDQTLNASSL